MYKTAFLGCGVVLARMLMPIGSSNAAKSPQSAI